MRLRLRANPGDSYPNVQRLARVGDVDGLKRALEYRELVPGGDGARFDLGVPVRIEALEALAAAPSPEARSAIAGGLADESVDVRLVALRLIEDYRDEQALDALTWAIGAEPLRAGRFDSAAYRSLAEKVEVWNRESLQALVGLDEPRALQRVAACMIDRPGDRLLADEDLEALRLLAATPQAQEFAARLAERFVSLLDHERPAVVARTEQVLTAFGASSLAPLVAALEKPSLRGRAVHALGKLKDKSITSAIAVHADDPDPNIRIAVMRALGDIRDPAGVRALLAGANDDSYDVRSAACASLDELGSAAMIVAVTSIIGPALQRIEGSAESNSSGTLALNAPDGSTEAFASPELGAFELGTANNHSESARPAGGNHQPDSRPNRLSGIRQSLGELIAGRSPAGDRTRRPNG